MIYERPLECGHVLTFDEIPPKVGDVVWCRRHDHGSVVVAPGRRVRESRKTVKAGA